MTDALHGGPPLMAQMWESASILLQTSPSDFSKLTYVDQMLKVQDILCKAPKFQFSVFVKDHEVHIQHLTPVCDAAPLCASSSFWFASPSPRKTTDNKSLATSKSVKKILTRLYEALDASDLDD